MPAGSKPLGPTGPNGAPPALPGQAEPPAPQSQKPDLSAGLWFGNRQLLIRFA